ncbi:MAG: hypothetical protein ACRENX_03630 [Candidatus Dormibacteria bacterium]
MGLLVPTLLGAVAVAGSQEPEAAIIVVVGCAAALLALCRAWLLLFRLLPLNRERARLRLDQQRLSPPG